MNIKIFLASVLTAAMLVGCESVPVVRAEPRKVAVQTYTFNRFSLEETLAKLKGLGLDGVECYPGQKLSAKYPNVKVGPEMSAEQRGYMKKLLNDAGLKMVSFGVASTRSEKETAKLCDFAQEFGCRTIVTEDCVSQFPIWERECEKRGMTMCLHNHGLEASNQYYDPYVAIKYTKNFKRVMLNPDVGHTQRAGFDPLASLKMYDGKIGSIHIKDHDSKFEAVALGKGTVGIRKMLDILDRQGYDGFFVIEYEANFDNNLAEVKECVDFLRKN